MYSLFAHPGERCIARLFAVFLIASCYAWCALADAQAQTRRAFVVGITKYSDGNLIPLQRSENDARDIAKDLEDLDFKRENIKVITDLKSKEDFLKALNEFLKNVQVNDQVFFFYSGHGYASNSDNSNYMLFTNLKSLLSFTKEKLPKDQAKIPAIVTTSVKQFEVDYESSEIQRVGISDAEVRRLIAARSPAVTIMVLDACRSLYNDPDDREDRVRRGLFHPKDLPPNMLVFYSASLGEEAIERFRSLDLRRNSLFTDIFRTAMKRPGVEIHDLVKYVRAQVSAAASNIGRSQVPDSADTLTREFRFIPSIGAERFKISPEDERCRFAATDWAQIENQPTRTRLTAHIEQFTGCGFDKRAKAMLDQSGQGTFATADDDGTQRRRLGSLGEPKFSECDQLAASEFDTKRPSDVPGVPFDLIGGVEHDTAKTIEICQAAALANPKIERYRFNLARALHAHAIELYSKSADSIDDTVRQELNKSFAIYKELSNNGYVAAMNNLAVFYESDLVDKKNPSEALRLYRLAAQQGMPLAMYNLALKYRKDSKSLRDNAAYQAREWMSKAREGGFIAAGIEEAQYLIQGRGGPENPRRAADLLQQAADSGSIEAKRRLAFLYLRGQPVDRSDDQQSAKGIREDTSKKANLDVPQNDELALLWFGRAAEAGDPLSQSAMAYLLESGRGLAGPQLALAERYWRAAAQSGDANAQVELAKRILDHRILTRSDNNQSDFEDKLKRAIISGEPSAAFLIANSYWPREPRLAISYAFKAIELASMQYPTTDQQVNENFFTEIDAGHLLVKIGHDPRAVDDHGQPLLFPPEVERLDKYYGKFDPDEGRVKVFTLNVPDFCSKDPLKAPTKEMRIWDWDRSEAPTEQQFRNLELWRNRCWWDFYREANSKDGSRSAKGKDVVITEPLLRVALASIYDQARKYKLNYPELLTNKIRSITGSR